MPQKLSALDRKKLENVFQRIENLTMTQCPINPEEVYRCVKCGLDIVWNNKKDNTWDGEYNRYFGGKNEPRTTNQKSRREGHTFLKEYAKKD